MGSGLTYRGYRAGEVWEIVVQRPGEPMRLLDLPRCPAEWALNLLTDYLGDQVRAAEMHHDFAALTSRRFTGDWELSGSDLEHALMEVEILRARMRIALARG